LDGAPAQGNVWPGGRHHNGPLAIGRENKEARAGVRVDVAREFGPVADLPLGFLRAFGFLGGEMGLP